MLLQFNKLFSPDNDSGSGSASGAGGGVMDTIELLGMEDEQESLTLEEKPDAADAGAEKAEEKEKEDASDDLEELEKELEGPKEEDLELMTPIRRKEILAKYPTLFKDFPYLERAYYRDQQFTELLPTIQDAKIAVDKSRVLDNLESHLMQGGSMEVILNAAKSENQESFNKIVDNYLPALRAVDTQAYYHVLGNVIKDTIITMVREARVMGQNGQPLQAAAHILNQFVFGSHQFAPPTRLSQQQEPQNDEREIELRQREQQITSQQFESVLSELQGKANNVLRATIDGHIDPQKTMTEYVRGHATQEAFDKLEDLMGKDVRFRGLIDKLWAKSFESGFSKESTDKIKSAYLSKAKTLLPSVIKRARNNALRGLGHQVEDTGEDSDKRGPIARGRSTSTFSGKITKASEIPKGMRTIDFLMKD